MKYSENAVFCGDSSQEMLAALKYGYPVVFKYGYPMGDECCDDGCCTSLKYGFPNKK